MKRRALIACLALCLATLVISTAASASSVGNNTGKSQVAPHPAWGTVLLQSGTPVADSQTPCFFAGYCTGPDGPVGGIDAAYGIGNPIWVYSPTPELLTVDVQDCCLVGDVYGVTINGAPMGITTPVPLYGPSLSTGSFSAHVGAGWSFVTIDDTLLSYIGFADPYGGGIVPGNFSPAGLSEQIYSSTTPEPGSLMLMGSGLLGLAGTLRRKLFR